MSACRCPAQLESRSSADVGGTIAYPKPDEIQYDKARNLCLRVQCLGCLAHGPPTACLLACQYRRCGHVRLPVSPLEIVFRHAAAGRLYRAAVLGLAGHFAVFRQGA